MRISYRTHPALKHLTEGLLKSNLIFSKNDEEWIVKNNSILLRSFNRMIDHFSSNIFYATDPFMEAVNIAKSKIGKIYIDEVSNKVPINVSGTYVTSSSVTMVYYDSINGSDLIYLFGFSKSGALVYFLFANGSEEFTFYISKDTIDENKTIDGILVSIIVTDYFRKYATVETDYLPPSKKVNIMNCNYINDTKLNITHLDSKWFTTLVKSDAFKVRGHFRLQPKKKGGEWTKELIWINDFQKEGYTAQAKKLASE